MRVTWPRVARIPRGCQDRRIIARISFASRLLPVLALFAGLACEPHEAEPCTLSEYETSRSCGAGLQFCHGELGVFSWGECVEGPVCLLEQNGRNGCEHCVLDELGVPLLDATYCADEPLACDDPTRGQQRDCGPLGTQFCGVGGWGECTLEPVCLPGDDDPESCEGCGLNENGVPFIDGERCGDASIPCDAASIEESRECGEGLQFCRLVGSAQYRWGACVTEPECVPGEGNPISCEVCVLDKYGVPRREQFSDCNTPLVLNFDGRAVEYDIGGRSFALGSCEATDWPTARTPWLALDRDRSGAIEGGHELFGSATRLHDGGLAEQGFAALAELDADQDGRISASDPSFAELVLWEDGDADRRSDGLELLPLAALGLEAIELAYTRDRRCDARGNCEVERAAFTWRDALGRAHGGEVVDLHLTCQ